MRKVRTVEQRQSRSPASLRRLRGRRRQAPRGERGPCPERKAPSGVRRPPGHRRRGARRASAPPHPFRCMWSAIRGPSGPDSSAARSCSVMRTARGSMMRRPGRGRLDQLRPSVDPDRRSCRALARRVCLAVGRRSATGAGPRGSRWHRSPYGQSWTHRPAPLLAPIARERESSRPCPCPRSQIGHRRSPSQPLGTVL